MMQKQKALVLWSGGKDCNLALHWAHQQQELEVIALVTFHSSETAFRAHSKELMVLQSQSLGIPHLFLEIHEPFAQQYELQLDKLKNQLGISVLISGDISEVHGAPNWITERATAVGMQTLLPLWHADRKTVLHQLIAADFEVIITLVKAPWLHAGFLGKTFNAALIDELNVLHAENGIDICGENGEFHTMVLNGPGYRSPISIDSFQIAQHEEMSYLDAVSASLNGEYSVPTLIKQKVCVECKKPFSCYTQGCWCADLPMIMPMENITDCMCPTCLKKVINTKLTEHKLPPVQ